MEVEYILYTKESCPWCVRAVNALTLKGKHFKNIPMDQNIKILEDIKDAYNWRTVPMVFHRVGDSDYTLVGGYTDLQKHLESLNEQK